MRQSRWYDLKQAGMHCVEQGITSIEEMMRVCFLEEEEDRDFGSNPEEEELAMANTDTDS